jgi:hypothetical protein
MVAIREMFMATGISTGRATIRLVDNEENGVLQWSSYLVARAADLVHEELRWFLLARYERRFTLHGG